MPDGEVYTSPLETATEGEISFGYPALFHGREVTDIRLRFEDGAVVEAEASRGREYLDAMLGMDDGARRLGEVAFGLNYEIDRFTQNTLFDEKIGGTMHVALGSAFKDLGGQNESALHWDLVCDLREEGEVYADGELVWRAGRFLETAAPVACLTGLRRLADVLVGYSGGVKPGDLTVIQGTMNVEPLLDELYGAVAPGRRPSLAPLRAGAGRPPARARAATSRSSG